MVKDKKRTPGGCIMAENVLKIPLKELKIVRLACQEENCGGAIEFPVGRLEGLTGTMTCPSCNCSWVIDKVGEVPGYKALGMALNNLARLKGAKVEFVVGVDDF
jgi:hypothetical protein